ncbi:Alpha/Beta hydrolase protein [Podospora aff. communis PSN243]|uniref:Alpha/Beta hydrolase protein n=1 Tax=Podospora aff. communis PSN243 TaxID=3040156 RepID=A0AAV9GV14_9PEZI|nr:Alpha/Beta hydrolase protein [Podospora aff. communis PSN243]
MQVTKLITIAILGVSAVAQATSFPYGTFPRSNDTLRLQPCPKTGFLTVPALNDTQAERTWAALFKPDPETWLWGSSKPNGMAGIFLCGYLDVPLDYTNTSDSRIVRLAVIKYQVSGLALVNATNSTAGTKSVRTILMNPGGPGGSGVAIASVVGEVYSQQLSDGHFDFLTWDPRGVGSSLPSPHCLPNEFIRDRWSFITSQHLAMLGSPDSGSLGVTDAYNEAIWRTCFERLGDIGRFLTTAFVARDLEQIRIALGEDDVTGYFGSYGTGIAQTYAAMFPSRVGRMVLDGTEHVRDHRHRAGFATASVDNVTDAYRDGFIGECIKAGPQYCDLAKPPPSDPAPVTPSSLDARVRSLLSSLASRPIPLYRANVGPTLITYTSVMAAIYEAMYTPTFWTDVATLLADLESGKVPTSRLLFLFENNRWTRAPSCGPPPNPLQAAPPPTSRELLPFVICADAYDAPEPNDMAWWRSLWANITTKSFISGDTRFYATFRCRHFTTFWPEPAEVFRGDLDKSLKAPVLLVAETYDPATPLRNGRRLAAEMGPENARLIVHHGYGHGMDNHPSKCTDDLVKAYVLHGKLPEKEETDCFAERNPFVEGRRIAVRPWLTPGNGSAGSVGVGIMGVNFGERSFYF